MLVAESASSPFWQCSFSIFSLDWRGCDRFVRGRAGVQGTAVEVALIGGGRTSTVSGERLVEAPAAPRALHGVGVYGGTLYRAALSAQLPRRGCAADNRPSSA